MLDLLVALAQGGVSHHCPIDSHDEVRPCLWADAFMLVRAQCPNCFKKASGAPRTGWLAFV
jgi:hypothetical protein